MNGAHSGEGHVSYAQSIVNAIKYRINLTIKDQIGLLERMIVGSGHTPRLVLDHEHRSKLGSEIAVDHHFHRDTRVDQEGCPHAG